MDAFWTQLDSKIVTFFNPLASNPSVRAAVRNNWPLHRLDQAVAVATLYLACVVACKVLLDKKERAGSLQSTKASQGEKKEKASVADKIKKDGIFVFVAMVVYNATQVALCGWMVYAALAEHRRRNLSLVCNVHDLAEDGMAFVLHVFYLSKILDFADTAFMILKNNWRQVSFLHVYHHTSIFLVYWLNANTNYDGDIYVTVVLNGAIHFIMYGYYLVTTFNIPVPVIIKKTITNMQLIQFCCMEAQGVYLLTGGCPSPYRCTVLYMIYISTMLLLFLDFKRRTYSKSKPGKDATDSAPVKKSVSSVSVPSTEASSTNLRDIDTASEAMSSSQTSNKADAQTATEVFINGNFYDTAGFKHPGGMVLKFFQGSGDATATFTQFHMRSKKASKILQSLPCRPAPAFAIPKIATERSEMDKDFLQLTQDLIAEGFFEPHMGQIFYRFLEIIVMFAVGFFLLLRTDSWMLSATGLLVLGLAEGRCGWLMHEGGHGSLTGNIKVDRNIQVLLYGVGCGMSAGWWRSNHNRHHATPQKLGHDADLETLPLVAFNAAVLKGVRSPVMRKWLQAQAYLFMPLTCFLVVLGWQLFLHPRYMVRTSKWLELASLAARYFLTFACVFSGWSWSSAAACYLIVQQLAGCYIFTNFALSHTHTDVVQKDEHIHWVEYASKHTVNLSDHWFVNWWMAYLNFQIEHHMFPTMPQFRHPQTSQRVRAIFEKHGLKYDVRGYFSCLGDTLNNLNDVGIAAVSKGETQKTK